MCTMNIGEMLDNYQRFQVMNPSKKPQKMTKNTDITPSSSPTSNQWNTLNNPLSPSNQTSRAVTRELDEMSPTVRQVEP